MSDDKVDKDSEELYQEYLSIRDYLIEKFGKEEAMKLIQSMIKFIKKGKY